MPKYEVTIKTTRIKLVKANSVEEAKKVAQSSKFPVANSWTEIKAKQLLNF